MSKIQDQIESALFLQKRFLLLRQKDFMTRYQGVVDDIHNQIGFAEFFQSK